jgi:methyl-accepting chemotaxis protein
MTAKSPVDVPIVTAKDAIAHHMRWRITLQLAVTMREPLSPGATRAIQHLEVCSIGKWLVSRHTLNVRNTPEYRDLVARHEEFHRVMTQIAFAINHGDYEAAGQALAPGSSFRKASQAISSAIMALDRIQSIAIAS